MSHFNRSLRSLFAALALNASAALAPAYAEYSFGTGSSSNGTERHYNIQLKDGRGNPVEFRLPMPEASRDIFRQQAVAVLRDYIVRRNMDLSDRDSSGFVYMIERLAQDSGLSTGDFVREIGMEPEDYAQLEYRRFRNGVLEEYNAVLDGARPNDWHAPGYALSFGDQTIDEINRRLAEAAAQYPADTAFQVRPLNGDDLRNIRAHIAKTYVDTGMKLLGILDRKEPGAAALAREIDEIVTVLYREIHTDPADQRSFLAPGNAYNRDLRGLMDEELARRGCAGQCRNDFYAKLVGFHNFHDRTDSIPPLPPVTKTQPMPQP